MNLEPDPVIEAYKKDIDRTLLRENLKLSVEARFANLQRFQRFAEEIAEAGRTTGDDRLSGAYGDRRYDPNWSVSMRSLTFWKLVTRDRVDLLEQLVELLRELDIPFCVGGGHAVNAYVEPLISLDLDLVVAADQLERLEARLRTSFQVETFTHGLTVEQEGSDLRIQVQAHPRYAPFLQRASERDVLGTRLRVAAVEDVFQGKIWAVTDSARGPSKRQKDLADIARLLEKFSSLRQSVPADVLAKLV